jgi:hypothetical protein
MSEAMPMSIQPPPPSAEQLTAWQALIKRIRQGDRSQVLAWDEGTAAKPDSTDDLFPAGNLDLQGTVGLRRAV